MVHLTRRKNFRAFSIAELLVSLGVLAIVLTIFATLLISTFTNALRLSARSSLREELTGVMAQIRRDVRSAQNVISCGDDTQAQSLVSCRIQLSTGEVVWQACPTNATKICKLDANGNVLYSSSNRLALQRIAFDGAFEGGSSDLQRNIVITLVVRHTTTSLGINNQVLQSSVATRNYDLTFSAPNTR